METAAVRLEAVSKTFGDRPVVRDLSFSIAPGEMFGLLGPNGAGKSTTIRMLTTLTKPSGGSIEIAGFDTIRDAAQVKQSIGVVLQQTSVDMDLTVWQNMEFHARLHHLPKADRKLKIAQWLDYVALLDRKDDLVKTLSGGMKRRLQIARALLHDPQILFLDEPTVGLDPQTRRRLWEIVLDLNKKGMTILLTTHYMEEVEYLCERICIMDAGEAIEVGTLDDFRDKYGRGISIDRRGETMESKFYPTVDAAMAAMESERDRAGMMVREANLEDIFVKLTGRDLN
ncbi:MAG: ABC transporter ATP-binding protein [Geitlerinemataceae cyanobacterium]